MYNRSRREQPRCAGCGHRRIHHYVGVTKPHQVVAETPSPCMVDVVTARACGCSDYRPAVRLEVVV